jgi:hypothetical protein
MKVSLLTVTTALTGKQKAPTCQHGVTLVGDWANKFRADVFEKKSRRYRHIDRVDQCTFPAKVYVDGVPMCRRHAGHLALDYLLAQSENPTSTE